MKTATPSLQEYHDRIIAIRRETGCGLKVARSKAFAELKAAGRPVSLPKLKPSEKVARIVSGNLKVLAGKLSPGAAIHIQRCEKAILSQLARFEFVECRRID